MSFRQQCAPVGRRRLSAQPEERQPRRLHHHRTRLQRGQHQHRGEAVRQHMAQHHAQPPRADRARRHDEVGGLHRQHLAAHQPGVLRRVDDADRDHRVGQARAEHRHDDQRQQQIGKRQQHIDHAHDQRVHPSADVARHQPERSAQQQRQPVRHHDRQQRRARAVEDAAQGVAAVLIGAEPVQGGGRRQRARQVLLVRVERRHQRREHRQRQEQHGDRQSEARARAEQRAPDHPGRRRDGGAHARLIRGSSAAYRMSTARFTSTNTTAMNSAPACTTE